MAYFAVDESDVLSLVDEAVSHLSTGEGEANWLALVDTAFDHEGRPLHWSGTSTRLYRRGRLEALNAFSPLLCQLSVNNSIALKQELATLIRHASGRPMLSFLRSHQNARELAQRLQDVLEVQTSDGQAFVLRLADTRALPAMAAAFQPKHWARVTREIDRWMLVNRRAKLENLPLPDKVAAADSDDRPIVLSDAELNQLLRLGEPDALTQSLFENFPELLPKRHHSDFYQLMLEVCEFGSRHRVTAFPELMSLAVAAASTDGELLGQPGLAAWLDARAWSQGHFEDGLANFMETAE